MSHEHFQLTVSSMLIQSGIQGMQTFRELKARTCNLHYVHGPGQSHDGKNTAGYHHHRGLDVG